MRYNFMVDNFHT